VIPLVILKCHQEPIQTKKCTPACKKKHLPAKKKNISDKATFLSGVVHPLAAKKLRHIFISLSLFHSQSVLIAILGKGLLGFPTDWLVLNGCLKK
jgi:hypothetical protein